MSLALYALLAWAATAAAARWVLPIRGATRLALALLPLVAAGAPLARGDVLAPIDLAWASEPLASARAEHGVELSSPRELHDVHTQMIPWRKAVRWSFREREWPLANPFVLGGDPLAPSAVPAAWHPVNLLALLLPLPQSYTFAAAATLLTAALAMFLLARDAGCRERVALVAAAGWAYSSYVGFWLGWPQGPAAAITPLVWLAARRLARSPGRGSVGLFAAAGALLLLSGHPESAFFAVVGAGVLFLAELARTRPRRLGASLGAALAGGALALALVAVDLLPFLDALGQTQQHAERSQIFAAMRWAEPLPTALENLRPNWVPFVHGVEGRQLAEPRRRLHAPAATTYAGSLLAMAALYGLARAKGRFRFALAGLAAAGLAMAVKLPIWVDLVRRLPLFGISLPEYGYLWAAPAVLLLAALGLERGLERRERGRFAATLAMAATALGLAVLLLRPGMAARGLGTAFVVAESVWLLVPLAFGAVAVRLAPHRRAAALILLALVLIQRRGEMAHLYRAFPERIFYPAVAPLDRLPRAGDPYRIVGIHYVLLPNSATMWELEDVRGYNAMTLARLAQTMPVWASQAEYWFNRVDELKPFLSMLNVRFALAPPDWPEGAGWKALERTAHWTLLENERAMPRAYVPRQVIHGGTPQERLDDLAKTWEFWRRAWIEPAGESPRPAEMVANGAGHVTEIARRGGGYRLHTSLAAPAWVVLTTPAWRGWRARAGGEEVPLGIAQHAFVAIRAPAGETDLEVFFRPRSFELGLALSVLAWLGVALDVARRALRRPRRAAS